MTEQFDQEPPDLHPLSPERLLFVRGASTDGFTTTPSRPIRPDLRDHVVLAGALGLAFGSTDPIADGADDVADLSAAITARWPDVRSYTAAEIVAGPRPFGFKLPAWRRLWTDESRLNWPNWLHDLTAPGGPATPAASAEALELAKRIASYIGGVTR